MEERIYRMRCVEGWSMVIPWDGYSLSKLLNQVQPLGSAKYVEFISLADRKQMPGIRSNIIPEEVKLANPGKNPASIRNTLALSYSKDLKDWHVKKIIFQHPDVIKHGFQYVDWLFDGKHILLACRTAFDDDFGGAHNNHDANFLTFYRIKKFRK